MINLFISSIEIELINELFYLKTKRLGSVFRMTLRLRTGYSLRVFESFFAGGRTILHWGTHFVLTDGKAQLLCWLCWLLRKSLRHLGGMDHWFLKEVMAVSSPGMHAIACYSHHVLLGGPLLSLPHEGTCSCQSR